MIIAKTKYILFRYTVITWINDLNLLVWFSFSPIWPPPHHIYVQSDGEGR